MSTAPETIFIDASIFIHDNFLESTRIKTILYLASKGHFRLMMTRISVNEIKAEYKWRVRAALDKHNTMINEEKNDVKILRNHSKGIGIIQKFPKEKLVREEFNLLLDQELIDSQAEILDYPRLDLTAIFDDYFNGNGALNASKKNEFSDVIAVTQIMQWCNEHKIAAKVLTRDRDFSNREGDYLTIIDDFGRFLEDKLKAVAKIERINALELLYQHHSTAIDLDILNWLNDALTDESIYSRFVNSVDIHGMTVKDTAIISKNHEITADDGENLEIEVSAHLLFKVSLNIDDENSGIYNIKDKRILFLKTTTVEHEVSDFMIRIKLGLNIISAHNYEDDYTILEYNDGKGLNLESDHN